MGLFFFDYDDLRKSKSPDVDLFSFFESTYNAGAETGGWPPFASFSSEATTNTLDDGVLLHDYAGLNDKV